MEDVVNICIGESEIGFITVDDLVNACKDIIEIWGKNELESKRFGCKRLE